MDIIITIVWMVTTFPFIVIMSICWIILKLIGIIILSILFFLYGLFITITSNPLNLFEFLKNTISNLVLKLLRIIFDDHSGFYDWALEYRYEHPVFAMLISFYILYLFASILDNFNQNQK